MWYLYTAPLPETGDEALPNAGAAARVHGMGIGVPAVEVADHGNALGVGGPHAEVSALLAVEFGDVSAKLFEQAVVLALVEQMKIIAGQQGGTSAPGRPKVPCSRSPQGLDDGLAARDRRNLSSVEQRGEVVASG